MAWKCKTPSSNLRASFGNIFLVQFPESWPGNSKTLALAWPMAGCGCGWLWLWLAVLWLWLGFVFCFVRCFVRGLARCLCCVRGFVRCLVRCLCFVRGFVVERSVLFQGAKCRTKRACPRTLFGLHPVSNGVYDLTDL